MDAITLASKKKRLLAIRRAFDSGARTVLHGSTSTTFRNLDEMERIIAKLEEEINGAEGLTRRNRVKYVTQRRKGL